VADALSGPRLANEGWPVRATDPLTLGTVAVAIATALSGVLTLLIRGRQRRDEREAKEFADIRKELRADVKALRGEIAQLRERIDELESALATAQSRVALLETENRRLAGELETAQQQLADAKTLVLEREAKLVERQGALDGAREEVAMLKGRLAVLTGAGD
jgi:chromosome segregation ATPase